jgi:hypothetical protein
LGGRDFEGGSGLGVQVGVMEGDVIFGFGGIDLLYIFNKEHGNKEQI